MTRMFVRSLLERVFEHPSVSCPRRVKLSARPMLAFAC
jgi:hypothetical protein